MSIVIILFYFFFPALLLYLGTKYSFINKIGVVVFCYVGGLIIGNVNIVPTEMSDLQGNIMGGSILLGIPLVLFSENILKWAKMAKYTFISLLLGIVSVVVMVFLGYFLLKDHIPEAWKVAGCLIGVYTGGTPNLAAIAQSLNLNEDIYILTHTVDLVIGAIVLLFFLTGAQKLFLTYLKPYKSTGDYDEIEGEAMISEFESYSGFFKKTTIGGLLKAMGLAVIVFVAGFGVSMLFEGDARDTAAILSVTTAGILLSLVPAVNKNTKSFQLGMYFIYVFCVIVASKANLREIFNPESAELLMYITIYVLIAVVGSLILHSILSWIFGINTDDFMMTSVALSNSPPFVPVVAAALRNKEVMIPGMIIGVLGYAIGNYLGVAIAYILKAML